MRDIASNRVNHKVCVMVIGGNAEDPGESDPEASSPSLSTEDVLPLSGIATTTGDRRLCIVSSSASCLSTKLSLIEVRCPESRQERSSSAFKTLVVRLARKSSGRVSRAPLPDSMRVSIRPLTLWNVSSAPSSTSLSSSSSSSWSNTDATALYVWGGRISLDSLSFRRKSRISLACRFLVVSRDALMARRERFVISRSAICGNSSLSRLKRITECNEPCGWSWPRL